MLKSNEPIISHPLSLEERYAEMSRAQAALMRAKQMEARLVAERRLVVRRVTRQSIVVGLPDNIQPYIESVKNPI